MYSAFAGGAIGVQAGFEEVRRAGGPFRFRGRLPSTRATCMKAGPDAVVHMLEQRNLRRRRLGPARAAGWATRPSSTQALEKLPAIAEACSGARALRCGTWVPPASNDMPREEMFRFLVDRLAPVCQVLRGQRDEPGPGVHRPAHRPRRQEVRVHLHHGRHAGAVPRRRHGQRRPDRSTPGTSTPAAAAWTTC